MCCNPVISVLFLMMAESGTTLVVDTRMGLQVTNGLAQRMGSEEKREEATN